MKTFFTKILIVCVVCFSNIVFGAAIVPPILTFAPCGTYPTAYQTLGNITLNETVSTADFSSFAGTATLTISCPSGYEFKAATGAASNTIGGATNVTVTGITVTVSTITITYTCGGTNKADNIDISGIQIRAISNVTSGNVSIAALTNAITGISVGITAANLFTYNSAASNDAICSAKSIAFGSCLTGEYNYCATADINTGCVTAAGRTVWYQVTMSGGNTVLNLDIQTGTATIQGVQLYTNCATPSAVGSDCASPYSFAGLTSGTTYFIGVNSATATAGTFSICATQATPAASGDLCAGAIALPTNGTTITGTTSGAGQEINWLSCSETRDVWYTFTTPASLVGLCYTFNMVAPIGSTDNAMGIFTGACGALTQVGGSGVCSPNQYIDMSSTEFTSGWAASTTYYVSVSTNGIQAFTLTANSTASIQANDACTGASAIQPTPVLTDNATNSCNYTYSNPSDASVLPAQLCASTLENISWYVLQASGSGVVSTTFSSVLCNNGGGGFQLGYFSGSCGALSNIGCQSAASGSLTVSISGVTSGTNIYFAMDGNAGSNCHWVMSGANIVPLPINLAEFTAESAEENVLLKWFTVSEINNRLFEIQKSKNGGDFEKIGSIDGHGTTNLPFNYQFIDKAPFFGNNYYRLKQIDNDGKFSYSEIERIQFSKQIETNLSVFPNPASDLLNINLFNSSNNTETKLIIRDITGRVVLEKNVINAATLSIDVSFLSFGSYIISAQNTFSAQSVKFCKAN